MVTTSSATFTFTSDQADAKFGCALDQSAFASCQSPMTVTVPDGQHHFYVIAVDHGNVDPTPAVWTWTADTTPPSAVRRHAVVRYRSLRLSWGALSAAGADLVVVFRGTTPGKTPAREVYRGSGSSYVDPKFQNGIYHLYRIVALDKAGNSSPPVDVAVAAGALLLAPRDGARLRSPPGLRWRTAPGAAYYNVQLYRRRQQAPQRLAPLAEAEARPKLEVPRASPAAGGRALHLVRLARLRAARPRPLRLPARAGLVRRALGESREHFVRVAVRVDPAQHPRDVAVGVDHEGRALVGVLALLRHAVRLAELVLRIGEQRERQRVLRPEALV